MGIKLLPPGDRVVVVPIAYVLGHVEAEAIHTGGQPEVGDLLDLVAYRWLVVVEIRQPALWAEGVVAVLAGGDLAPVAIDGGVATAIEVLIGRIPIEHSLEPGVLLGGVVDDQIGDHLHVALVSFADQGAEIIEGAIVWMDAGVVTDCVAMIGRTGLNGHQPQSIDPQILQVVELLGDARQIAGAIAIAVIEAAHEHLVDHLLVPIVGDCGGWLRGWRGGRIAGVAVGITSRQQQAGGQQGSTQITERPFLGCVVHWFSP